MSLKALWNRMSSGSFVGLVLALIVGGCTGRDDGPAIYPVTGTILVDGQPAAKAQVTFHPLSGSSPKVIPFAETDTDGSFQPSSRATRDGAPAGDYTLTVIWPEIRVDHGEEVAGRDRLGGRYNQTSVSTFKVTIKEGENRLAPLELKSSR